MGSLGGLEILLIALIGPVLYVSSLVWAYRDAESRGSNGVLVVVMVAVVAWPLGIFVWMFIRPKQVG